MKHAVYCATRNMYEDMETAAKSLAANSDVDVIHFLIEDEEFPRELPPLVVCHDVSGQEWFEPGGPNYSNGWTWMVLMRAALCHVLEDVDMVLSLDCDTVCVRDVSDVWDIDISDSYLAMVGENHKSGDGLYYGNYGVSLMNLAKLRDGKADEIIEVLNRRRYTWPEQDVTNYLCQGRIAELNPEYNYMAWNRSAVQPRIIHYAGQREWRHEHDVAKYRNMSWDEVIEKRNASRYSGKVVMFTSDHTLERAENLRAVYDAYRLPKRFVQGTEHMSAANDNGYAAVVCDTLPRYMPNKGACKTVIIGHGLTGDKKYALDEVRAGIDGRAFEQIDCAIATSTHTVGIVTKQFGISADRVAVTGMPRTDQYVGKRKGDGGTFMAKYRRAYLYAPTYRSRDDGGHLARIDWEKLDSMLEDDEVLVVKRHYFMRDPIVTQDVDRIIEVPQNIASAPYLIDCDVVVTDYSSIMFDAYLLGKPTVLVVDDMGTYKANRGMYMDYPSEYGSRWIEAEGNEERLLDMMREAADNGMGDVERACIDRVGDMCDGHATERVIDIVKGFICGS